MCLPVQRELAGVVQHHELLQQALDHLFGGGLRADVELLHAVARQVEGRPLLRVPALRFLLVLGWVAVPLRARRLHGRDGDRSTQPQVHLNETSVRPVFSLEVQKYNKKSRLVRVLYKSEIREQNIPSSVCKSL